MARPARERRDARAFPGTYVSASASAFSLSRIGSSIDGVGNEAPVAPPPGLASFEYGSEPFAYGSGWKAATREGKC